MKRTNKSLLLLLIKNQDGQALPWMVLLMVLFLGAAGITVDLGHAYVCYRQLQASTDAAALAGAWELGAIVDRGRWIRGQGRSCGTVLFPMGSTPIPTCPARTISTTLSCAPAVSAMGVSCYGPVGANALQVKQTRSHSHVFHSRAGGIWR